MDKIRALLDIQGGHEIVVETPHEEFRSMPKRNQVQDQFDYSHDMERRYNDKSHDNARTDGSLQDTLEADKIVSGQAVSQLDQDDEESRMTTYLEKTGGLTSAKSSFEDEPEHHPMHPYNVTHTKTQPKDKQKRRGKIGDK